MIEITDDDWQVYLEKYGRLMWTVSRHISGDPVVADLETNYADLCVAALESIRGFHKKTGESFDEMICNPLFNQYTKTVLWNCKNKKGAYITKRKELSLSSLSTDREGRVMEFDEGTSVTSYNGCLDELLSKTSLISKDCIKELYENPELLDADINIYDNEELV